MNSFKKGQKTQILRAFVISEWKKTTFLQAACAKKLAKKIPSHFSFLLFSICIRKMVNFLCH
jgi:hypothetical protein